MKLDLENAKKVINLINERGNDIEFGKLFVEITISNNRATNIQVETRKSVNLNSA